MLPLDINVQEDNLFNQKVNEKKQTLPKSRIINSDSDLFMYWSKGNPKVDLNCEKKNATKDEGDRRIVCRHLAPAQLSHDKKSLNSVSYHEAFKNLTKIPFLRDNIADKRRIKYKADSYHLVNTSNIGQKLAELVLASPLQENKPLLILFYSENHVMSIKIKCREVGFGVQFYDPNKTLAHKQIWFPNAESIAKLTLSHLIAADFQQAYFPKFNSVIATYADKNFSDPSTSTFHTDEYISSSEQLYYALSFGQPSAVVAAMQDIFNSNLDNAKKEIALTVKNAQGFPGLFIALQEGHHEAVTAYVNAILESNLNKEQKQNLLAAKYYDVISGLYMALEKGHHETVAVYVNAILKSNLDTEQKRKLLAAKRDVGIAGLSMALRGGHHETVIVYVKAILESNLNKEQKQNLLSGHRADGFFSNAYQDIMGNLRQVSLDNTKKTILDYLKFSLADKKTTTNDKIDLLFDAINPQETIGEILFTSSFFFDFTIFQCAKARLTAGSLNTVMMLIKNLNMNLDNDEDKAYLKQKCQGITNVDHREYVNAFLFANDTPEILNALAPRMA